MKTYKKLIIVGIAGTAISVGFALNSYKLRARECHTEQQRIGVMREVAKTYWLPILGSYALFVIGLDTAMRRRYAEPTVAKDAHVIA